MSGYVDHAWRHAPKELGGTDPIPSMVGTLEARFEVIVFARDEPVVGAPGSAGYIEQWPVPRGLTDPENGWYIFDPEAAVVSPSTAGDIEIWLYRVRHDADTVVSISSILDEAIWIEEGQYFSRAAATQPVVSQYSNLMNSTVYEIYDSIMVQVYNPGAGAVGLSVVVPIGVERPAGSGYHTP